MDFCRRRHNKLNQICNAKMHPLLDSTNRVFWSCFPVETSKLHQKSMEYDAKTIYKHEIDMLMRFLMAPCFENHHVDEF